MKRTPTMHVEVKVTMHDGKRSIITFPYATKVDSITDTMPKSLDGIIATYVPVGVTMTIEASTDPEGKNRGVWATVRHLEPGEPEFSEEAWPRCPDDGRCWHGAECETVCWRVMNASPFGPRDQWPDHIKSSARARLRGHLQAARDLTPPAEYATGNPNNWE